MKKTTAIFLALMLILASVAACSNKADTEKNGVLPPADEQVVFQSPQIEAVVRVAESYLARGKNLQYDTMRLVNGTVDGNITYRLVAGKYSPEDASSQYTTYTHCAAFCYDVYKEALGIDMGKYGVSRFMSDTDMHAFTYYLKGTETEEQKQSILDQFKRSIQIGDILTCLYADGSGGHAMLYVGGGELIHSTWLSWEGGGAFNEGEGKDRTEPNGTVERRALETIFQEDNYFYFWNQKCWALVRPMIKYPDAMVTQETQNRINNLLDVYVEKTSTHPGGITADLGEEITYSICLRNDGSFDKKVEIKDQIPDGTSFVSGDIEPQDKSLTKSVTVKAGESTTISYTVKVNNDPSLYEKGYVWFDGATVGGVGVSGRPVYIGKHLSKDEQQTVAKEIKNIAYYDSKSLILAEQIYAKLNIDLKLVNASNVVESMFTGYGDDQKHMKLNTAGQFADMLVHSLYGGKKVVDCEAMHTRTRGIRPQDLYIGDIIVSRNGNTRWTYMYAGDGKLLYLGTPTLYDEAKSAETLAALLVKDEFIVLRPAAK